MCHVTPIVSFPTLCLQGGGEMDGKLRFLSRLVSTTNFHTHKMTMITKEGGGVKVGPTITNDRFYMVAPL
jgi:hypothetical protein